MAEPLTREDIARLRRGFGGVDALIKAAPALIALAERALDAEEGTTEWGYRESGFTFVYSVPDRNEAAVRAEVATWGQDGPKWEIVRRTVRYGPWEEQP